MTKFELMERLETLNAKARSNCKAIYFSDDEYVIFEKAYIALDLDKDIFAKLVYADARAFLDNEKKWDFITDACDYYRAELKYERELEEIATKKEELERLTNSVENYEKNRRFR